MLQFYFQLVYYPTRSGASHSEIDNQLSWQTIISICFILLALCQTKLSLVKGNTVTVLCSALRYNLPFFKFGLVWLIGLTAYQLFKGYLMTKFDSSVNGWL